MQTPIENPFSFSQMIPENTAFKIMLDTLKDFMFCKQDDRKQKKRKNRSGVETKQFWLTDGNGGQ